MSWLALLAFRGVSLLKKQSHRPQVTPWLSSKEAFSTTMERMEAAKPEVMQRQRALLTERYDLSNRPAKGVTMSRGKAV